MKQRRRRTRRRHGLEPSTRIVQNPSIGSCSSEAREDPESLEIFYSELKCLEPGECLTSTIMNFYIRVKGRFPNDLLLLANQFRLRFCRFVVALRGDQAIERLMTPLQRRCPMFMLQLDTWQRRSFFDLPSLFPGSRSQSSKV